MTYFFSKATGMFKYFKYKQIFRLTIYVGEEHTEKSLLKYTKPTK